jgi:hypothetical protein
LGKETTYNGQGGGKPTIFGQRGLFKQMTNYLKEKATQSCLEDKRGQQINKTMTWKRKQLI